MENNKPSSKKGFEWNFNTIMQLLTLGTMLFGFGLAWQSVKGDIGILHNWKVGIESKIDTYETEIKRLTSVTENLNTRMGISEQTTNVLLQGNKDLQSGLSLLSADIKVMREILLRVEAQNKTPR